MAEPGAQQPELPPLYAGPTPADPFGGHAFDIFDALEQAEAQEKQTPAPAVTSLPIVVGPPPAIEPVDDLESALEVRTPDEPSATEGSPEPPLVSQSSAPSEPHPSPEPPAPANDRDAEPAIRPIVIGAEDKPPVEKKRGWWRR